MERTKNDVWVGLFVLIGAAALVFLALQAANLLTLSFQPTYHLSARFDNVGGLKPRAAVKSAAGSKSLTVKPSHHDSLLHDKQRKRIRRPFHCERSIRSEPHC